METGPCGQGRFRIAAMTNKILHYLGHVLFVACFVGTVVFFQKVDVYHTLFFASMTPAVSAKYIVYNLLRVVFMVYLAWIIYTSGRLFFKVVSKERELTRNALDAAILYFFSGAALLHGVLFVLGYFSLYYLTTALIVSLPLIVFSYNDFVAVVRRLRNVCGGVISRRNESFAQYMVFVFAVIVLLASGFMLCMKGLYPGNISGDYVHHYFPYFKEVLRTHSILPNDLWYQYYYSKGNGIVYLSMLLTDIEISTVVSCCFFFFSVLTIYSLVSKVSENRFIPLTACFLYQLMIYIDPYYPFFNTHHIIAGSFYAAILWVVVEMDRSEKANKSLWMLGGTLIVAGFVIFFPPSFAIVALFLVIMIVKCGIMKDSQSAARLASILVSGLLMILITFVINYVITGMAEVTPFRLFWKLADQKKLSEWVSPYLMVLLEQGTSKDIGGFKLAGSIFDLKYILGLFRVISLFFAKVDYFILFVLLPGIIGIVLYAKGHRAKLEQRRTAIPLVAFLTAAFIMCLLATAHPHSYLRNYVFIIFFVVVGFVLLWNGFITLLPFGQTARRNIAIILGILIVCLWSFNSFKMLPDTLGKAYRAALFIFGKTSYSRMYEAKRALWKPALEARRILGVNKRIWSFTLYNFYMGPDPGLETAVSFSLKRDWHGIMFSAADESKRLLREQGLDYFLIDLETNFFDFFQYTRLFSPESIGRYFGVVWKNKDENVYLLSWKENACSSIPGEFIGRYKNNIVESEKEHDFSKLYERMKDIYLYNNRKAYPVIVEKGLLPVEGWQ